MRKFQPLPVVTTEYRYFRMVPTQLGDNTKTIIYPAITIYANAVQDSMYITNGNLGIGVSSPSTNLNVVGNVMIGDQTRPVWNSAQLDIVSNGVSSGIAMERVGQDTCVIGNNEGNLVMGSEVGGDTVIYSSMNDPSNLGTEIIRFTNGGYVGIGTTTPATALVVKGTIRNINGPAPTSGTSLVITASGDIAPQSSDARYKTNVEDLPSVLEKLMDVRAVSYNWKDETQKWYGLLAQQLAEVFPEAAWHNETEDTFGVHYTPSVVTLLLKAIQEIKQTYDQRIGQLQEEINLLKSTSL